MPRGCNWGAPYFNSRPSGRGDAIDILDCIPNLFQFTPLREGRLIRVTRSSRSVLFQFTPLREGRRAGNGNRLLPPEISIHAPPRGATVQPALALHLRPYFNSRPSARGDADVFRSFLAAPHFNSRPSARGDSSRRGTAARQSYFNSRPSARGDGAISTLSPAIAIFQFPPLREGRPFGANASNTPFLFQFPPLREGRHPYS